MPDGVGLDLTGFLSRENPSIGMRDPLYARALWLDDGERTLAWTSVDMLAVPWKLGNNVGRRLRDERGRSPHALSVCATHTHSAPAALFVANCGLVDRSWVRALEDLLVEVIAEAADNANRHVRLRFATTDAPGYSCNRRTQHADGTTRIGEVRDAEVLRRGPLDTTLSVLTAHDAVTEQPVAAVVHFPCHPVFCRDQLIGPDWPGRLIGTVRKQVGAEFMAMFVQGACGDVDPKRPLDPTDEKLAGMGDAIADRALACIGNSAIGTWLTPCLSGRTSVINLRWRSAPSEDELARHLLSPADWTRAAKDAQAGHLWATRVLKMRERGWWKDGIQMPVQVIVLGELAVAAFGAEVFTQTSLDLKAAQTDRPILVLGYANDDVGYLPPAVEHEYGGYEIERAFRYYGYPDVFAPESERIAREAALSMIRRMQGRRAA